MYRHECEPVSPILIMLPTMQYGVLYLFLPGYNHFLVGHNAILLFCWPCRRSMKFCVICLGYLLDIDFIQAYS